MYLFQILDIEGCEGIGPIVQFIKHGVWPIIQIGIPILLILMGAIDLGKAVIASDDKAIKMATSSLIKRAIAAIAIFFVVTLVSLIFGWLGNVNDPAVSESSWYTCWNKA